MAQYVTVADVDELLGAEWAVEAEKARAVAMANAFLSAKRIQLPEPVPSDILLAGAELAAAAVSGDLYRQYTQGIMTRKRVKADDVESEKQFSAVEAYGANAALSERVQFALALVEQYKTIPMGITVGYGNGYPG